MCWNETDTDLALIKPRVKTEIQRRVVRISTRISQREFPKRACRTGAVVCPATQTQRPSRVRRRVPLQQREHHLFEYSHQCRKSAFPSHFFFSLSHSLVSVFFFFEKKYPRVRSGSFRARVCLSLSRSKRPPPKEYALCASFILSLAHYFRRRVCCVASVAHDVHDARRGPCEVGQVSRKEPE